jgi:hypothetical protein
MAMTACRLVTLAAASALMATAGCSRSSESSEGEHGDAELSWYRAQLDFGADLPRLSFFLGLPAEAPGKAMIKNGQETQELDYNRSGDEVRLEASWNYESDIIAEADEDGTLHGRWRRVTPLWGEVIRDFHAVPIDAPEAAIRYPGEAAQVSIDGRWELSFDEHGPGQAHFVQKDDVVTGFVKAGGMGDSRFLAGNVRGNRLIASTFNGNVANLVTAEISADGSSLSGLLSIQNVWNEAFTGTRTDELSAQSRARLRDGTTTISAAGLARMQGKPALVMFFATWCPSCKDALPFVTELVEQYRPKGVEFLALQ